MIEACLTATDIDYVRLAAIGRGVERYIRFVPLGEDGDAFSAGQCHPVRLHFTSRRLAEPILVDPGRGVAVSTWGIAGVCHYAGIDEDTYLLMCSLIGIAQWRVLKSNPLLKPEDLIHPQGVRCVYMSPRQVNDYALLLDRPVVCKGCLDFYLCLGAETEILALREVIGSLEFMDESESDEGEAEEPQEFESDY